MKRLLAISWEMPPLSGPRAVQVTRTLRHLVPLGWTSTVVCFGPRSDRYNQDYRIDVDADGSGAIELVRVASPEEWLLFRALWRIVPPVKQLPDEKWVWIHRAASAALRLAETQRFSALVSFGQPWSDHLVALRVHREISLPWVAHFSDPWVDSPYVRGFAWQRRIWRRMERQVVEEADRVVFQNRQTAAHTMEKYPAPWKDKVAVIPQGFERDSSAKAAAPLAAAPLRIVHTGRFYPGVRTPERVLDALARLAGERPLTGRLQIDFFGEPFAPYARRAARLGLEEIVRFHGRVPPHRAMSAARDADALLLIDAHSRGPNLFLPSKLVDYLALEKPIVGITPIVGASADVLRAIDAAIVEPDDVPGIARMFAGLIDQWERRTLAISLGHLDAARAYDIRETTKQFAAVLDGLAPAAAGAA